MRTFFFFFFFFETIWFRAEKTFEFRILAEKSLWISVKTFFFFYFYFLETTWFWAEKTFEFRISAEKNILNFGEDLFFFWRPGNHLILGGKDLWISDFGWKITLNFGEDYFFFFCLETTWFWAEKTFEFPSFPRNFVSIFGQTVWNWFKNNENSGQGRLHFSHSFKIAPPPFPNPGYAPDTNHSQKYACILRPLLF